MNLRRLVNRAAHREGQRYAAELAERLLREVRERLAAGEAAEAVGDDLLRRYPEAAGEP